MTAYDDDYPTCKGTYATLRIYSDDMSPSAVSSIPAIEPSRTFVKGEPMRSGQLRKFNGWFLTTKGALESSRDTRRHVDQILARVGGKGPEFDRLRSAGCEIDISCFWVSVGHGGPVIEPAQMLALGKLGISIWWDVRFIEEPFEDSENGQQSD